MLVSKRLAARFISQIGAGPSVKSQVLSQFEKSSAIKIKNFNFFDFVSGSRKTERSSEELYSVLTL